jgi:hypothetical protein
MRVSRSQVSTGIHNPSRWEGVIIHTFISGAYGQCEAAKLLAKAAAVPVAN